MNSIDNSKRTKRGIYFLANDTTFELTIAFLNSFRCYNPEIALCMIPFDDDSQKIKALSERYRFTIWDDSRTLEACDEISRKFHEHTCGAYRKLAMWDGIFDEFVYIDVDMVVLANINFVFQFLLNYDVITSHSNYPNLQQWVWKNSIFETNKLTKEQIEFSANTGFIVSKKSAFNLKMMTEKLSAAEELRPHMELACMEQPLLNYYFITSDCRYTSLVVISWLTGCVDIKFEKWGGESIGIAYKGRIYFQQTPVFLVHWAGSWQPTRFDEWWYKFTKRLGFQTEKRNVRFFMPNKRLWTYYRKMKPTNDKNI